MDRGRARAALLGVLLAAALGSGGCTTTALVITAVSVATDTSVSLQIAKHVIDKLNDGQPPACDRLDSVERALSPRCGAFAPGSIDARDVRSARLQTCPLGHAAQDVRLWPVLPELIAKGAQPEHCPQSPLLKLAQRDACPDFTAASPESRQALMWLAEADARAIRHDVMRMFSCPGARAAGMDAVLDRWLASGALEADAIGFGALGALHPSHLGSPLARALEARGHTARAALGGHDGKLPSGFELALRTADWAALDWWLDREPELARSVTPMQADQLPWLPLARVLVPSFVERPETQPQLVSYLLARGASPAQRMPFDRSLTVKAYAARMKSPHLALMEPAQGPTRTLAARPAATRVAASMQAPVALLASTQDEPAASTFAPH